MVYLNWIEDFFCYCFESKVIYFFLVKLNFMSDSVVDFCVFFIILVGIWSNYINYFLFKGCFFSIRVIIIFWDYFFWFNCLCIVNVKE